MPPSFQPGVVLVLTGRCNLACSYCYQAGREATGELPWEAARVAIDHVLAPRPPAARVAFTGGEPFLARELLRRCVEHARAAAARGTALAFEASTNGTRLDEDLARYLAANDFELQVSWDGAAQEDRAPGTAALVENGIRALAAADAEWFRRRVRVALTLTPGSIDLLPRSVEAILSLGVRDVAVAPADGILWPGAGPLEAAFDRALAGVARSSLPHVRPGERHPVGLLREPPAREPGGEEACGCAAGSPLTFAVAPDGTAWGCSGFAAPMQRLTPPAAAVSRALRLGDVRAAEFPARLAALPAASAAARALTHREAKRSPLAECRSCALLATCPTCPAAGTRDRGNDDPDLVPVAHCALARSAARARALLPRSLPALLHDLEEAAALLGPPPGRPVPA